MLSEKIGRAFLDTDVLLENLFESEQGKRLNCKEIFLHLGPKTFRALESEIILSLQDVQHSIISIGGGAILDPANAELLQKMGKLVYLVVPKEELKKRMLEGDVAAYLDESDPDASFERMYNARIELYEKIPALKINTEEQDDTAVLQQLEGLLSGE